MERSNTLKAMMDNFDKLSQEFDTNLNSFLSMVDKLPKQALVRVFKKTLANPLADENIKLEHRQEELAFALAAKIQQNKLAMASQSQAMNLQASMEQNKTEVKQENSDG